MIEQDDVRILHNKRDNITYFLHIREEKKLTVSIAREVLEVVRQIQNAIIVITIPNDISDSTKGVIFYGLPAYKWYDNCTIQEGRCTIAMNMLRNMEGFNK